MRKRFCRQVMCLTLAIMLVVGMLPGVAMTAHANTTITKISVSDITTPEVGETPDYTASVLDGEAYYIGTDITGTNSDVNGILWVNNGNSPINQDVTFAEGGSYDVRMEIYAKSGAVFGAKADLDVTINGQPAHVISRTDTMIYIRYTFGAPKEKELIDSVALTMEGHKLGGKVRGLTFTSNDPIKVGSAYGTEENYVVYLSDTENPLTFETSVFYPWQQYYVGYYLEPMKGYTFGEFANLSKDKVTLNGKPADSLTLLNDGRIRALFSLEKLGYIHEIELSVVKPVSGQSIEKPTVVSVNGDPNLKNLLSVENSKWSYSPFFVDGAEYETVSGSTFQDGYAYKLELDAICVHNDYMLADDCQVTVKTSDGQVLQKGESWLLDFQEYRQTNYFNLNAPTAYDTLKTWDMEIYGYNGGASLMNLSAKVTANGKTLMLPAGETFMIYEASFAEPEPPYLIKCDTQYILTMPLLTVDMGWPGVGWVIDDINNVKITLHGQPLSNSDLMEMEGHWWVMYKLPILKEGVECNGLSHDFQDIVEEASFEKDGKTYQQCSKGCGTIIDEVVIPKISTAQLSQTSFTYDGQNKKPSVAVIDSKGKALTEGVDYTVICPDESKTVGTYAVLIALQGNYTGTKTLAYKIVEKPHICTLTKVVEKAATCTTEGKKAYYACDCGMYYEDEAGSQVIENFANWGIISVKDHNYGNDYICDDCKYENEQLKPDPGTPEPGPIPTPDPGTPEPGPTPTPDPGTPDEHVCVGESVTTKATLSKNGKIESKCKTCGAILSTKTIYRAKTVKLNTTKYTYNGKVKSPTVVVKDSKGNTISSKNYTITKAKGRKNVGKYTYKITFKNQYTGTKSLTFTINPKTTSITKKPTASKKAFTVKWKKVSAQATGYQVMYSTSKNFTSKTSKTVTIKSYKTTSKKVTGLKAKKTYYVKVRTYKTVNGKKYYSDWSSYKTVKTR